MYKLVACDIDGTLINNDFKLTERTVRAVRAATAKGVHFVPASGRIYGSARVYARELGLSSAVLACNGAIAKNVQDKKVIFSRPIDQALCEELFRQFEKDGTYFQFYAEDVFYAPQMVEEAMYFWNWATSLPPEDQIPVRHAPDPCAVPGVDPVYKIYIKSEGERRQYHEKMLGGRGDLTLTSSWGNNFEINGAGVSKADGVERYARTLGIRMDEVICIGDELNDVDMIRAAGLGVAMGNAKAQVKEHAGYIADTNENDGVAKVLEKYVL